MDGILYGGEDYYYYYYDIPWKVIAKQLKKGGVQHIQARRFLSLYFIFFSTDYSSNSCR
jgi:hypothetical protein